MWMVSPDAGSLLSVVKMDAKKFPAVAKAHGAMDPDVHYLVIRSRIKESVEYLIEVLGALHGDETGWGKPILDDDKKADYRFRTIVTATEWKEFLCFEVDGIDYTSHVKEETRDRAPEGAPRASIYSAMMATWSAWSKLQPTPPYGGGWASYYAAKPDCKNCNHPEIKHSVKGDHCNVGWKWIGAKQTREANACDCAKYEPKAERPKAMPSCECDHAEVTHTLLGDKCNGWKDGKKCDCQEYKPVKPPATSPPAVGAYAVKSAEESAGVFLGEEWTDDGKSHVWDFEEGEFGHSEWCPWLDGDECLCKEPDYAGDIVITQSAVEAELLDPPADATGPGHYVDGVWQELALANESPQQKKARYARNKRRRRQARKAAMKNG